MDINKNISFKDPVEFLTVDKVLSADEAIRNAVQVEIIPREQSSFGFNDSNINVNNFTSAVSDRLRFYINDSSHYLDMRNSYINCEFQAIVLTAGNVNIPDRFIDEGGIHSSIRTVTVSIGGAVLGRIDDYSKWYNATKNFPMHSSEYRDRVLASSGDSSEDVRSQNVEVVNIPITSNNAQASITASSGLLTLLGGAATTELQVGDVIEINTNSNGKLVVDVLAINNDNAIVISNPPPANIPINSITAIVLVKRNNQSTRKIVANGEKHNLSFNLPLGCLQLPEYFPLPLIQPFGPLEIDIEFNPAEQVLVLENSANVAAGNKFAYTIIRPRFIARMIRPGNVINAHKALFNSMGLMFPYVSWRHFENNIPINTGDTVLNIQTNLKSARSIVSVATDQTRANSSSQTAQNYKSQSTFLRDNLGEYRYLNGAMRMPEYGVVDMKEDTFASQAWQQYMLSVDMYNDYSSPSTSIKPYQWKGFTSERFVASTPFKKHNSFFTGLDLSNNFLECELNMRTGRSVATAYHSWISFDSLLVISRANGVRVYR